MLNFIRLTDKADAKVEHLSGGMKKRLTIARALLHRPKILQLDEPTTRLDPNVRQEIWEKLEELRRAENLTIVLSTQYIGEAEKLEQCFIVMSHGKNVIESVPAEIIHVMNFCGINQMLLRPSKLEDVFLQINDDKL